jgi:rod shape-determining protein MreC
VAAPRRTGRSRLTLALLILTSLAVLTLDFRDAGPVRSIRSVVGTVFSPLRGLADAASTPFTNVWGGITDYGDVKSENEKLHERLAELEGTEVEAKAAIEQFAALAEQLNIPWVGTIPTAPARVISGPVGNFSHTIEIGKGSGDGIKAGMPVVTGAGLVGQVVQTSSNTATVRLITDPDFRVGVRMTPGSIPGTARGSGTGEPLVVDTAIDPKTEIPADAVLTTSGADRSAFPASIPVAAVVDKRTASGGLTADLLAEPYADTERLPFVTVLLLEDPG